MEAQPGLDRAGYEAPVAASQEAFAPEETAHPGIGRVGAGFGHLSDQFK